jgi:hypothetical protein
VVGAVALVVVIAAVAAVLVLRDSGDDTSEAGPGTTAASNGDDPEPDDPEPDGSGVDPDRASRVAEAQIIGASSSTVDCLAGELEGQPDLVDIIEDQTQGVALDSSSDARLYSSIVMSCASVDELVSNLSTALSANGVDDYSVGCFEAQASALSSSDWEELVQIIVQPSRASELQQVLETLTIC